MPKEWKRLVYLGITRDVCIQAYTDSCAIACIAMAVNRIDGSHPTERAVMNCVTNNRQAVRPARGYQPSPQDLINAEDPLFRETRGQTTPGTFADSIPSYLNAYDIPSAYSDTRNSRRVGNWLWDVETYPLIVKVRGRFRTGGKHFILIDSFKTPQNDRNYNGECEFVVRDPDSRHALGVATIIARIVDDGFKTTYVTGAREHWTIEEMVSVGRQGTVAF
jgi:hypothetical protein